MSAAIDRLIEWRDHGTGPVSYSAGSKEFWEDVGALLGELASANSIISEQGNAIAAARTALICGEVDLALALLGDES